MGTEFEGIPTSERPTLARSRKRPFEGTPAGQLKCSAFVQLSVNLGTALVVIPTAMSSAACPTTKPNIAPNERNQATGTGS